MQSRQIRGPISIHPGLRGLTAWTAPARVRHNAMKRALLEDWLSSGDSHPLQSTRTTTWPTDAPSHDNRDTKSPRRSYPIYLQPRHGGWWIRNWLRC
jgi:hypothetical protein